MLTCSFLKKLYCYFPFLSKNTKKYGHVLSLGYNCEVSFQFFKYYHFLEAGLFSWVGASDIKTLTNALNNFNAIASGDFKYNGSMWQCLNSSICFHGKFNVKATDVEALNADKKDLISRTAYLKKKFLSSGSDGKKNLYIYKHSIRDSNEATLFIKDIQSLYNTLKTLIQNDFDLLVVAESKTFPALTEKDFKNDHIYFRTVEFFTPETSVTQKNNDRKHWKKIFKEFRPDFKLKKTKKYKFEEV